MQFPTALRYSLASVSVVVLASTVLASIAHGETGPLVERFQAVTTNMTPDGLALRIDILRWSTDDERQAMIDALAAGGNAEKAIEELPTLGYVWPSDSGIGYSLKYAHRLVGADGEERVTVVTGRPLGTFGRESWQADVDGPAAEGDYTVLELRLDQQGQGTGTMSLAADVSVDASVRLIRLSVSGETPVLLDPVTREPEPYWARQH